MNREEWQNYEYSLKTYRDNLATDKYLIQHGEHTKALAIARKLKLSGMPIDEITQVTELSKEEIAQL